MMLFKSITAVIIATAAVQLCLLDGVVALPVGGLAPITAHPARSNKRWPVTINQWFCASWKGRSSPARMSNDVIRSTGQTDSRPLNTLVQAPGIQNTFRGRLNNMQHNANNNGVEFLAGAAGAAAALGTASLLGPAGLPAAAAGVMGGGMGALAGRQIRDSLKPNQNNNDVAPIIPNQKPKTLVVSPTNPPFVPRVGQ
ncbi:hypothetical protein BDF22DRAFT_658095 [Syncephalis plumigaleata]|nr:hypothetical protein BDF22DRAFT_658095 [Syncephalis plumigaleata]